MGGVARNGRRFLMKKILVVEDDPVNATIVGDFLASNGYAVALARNGVQGIEMCASEQPDMMLVDVMLPRRNGFEVCFEVKRTAHGRDMPLVLMSAVCRDDEDVTRYSKDGLHVEAYLNKPFSLSRLLAQVQASIGAPTP
jgi:CheY-like chemotaxis protein